jgi:putative addiction module killer protein
LLEFKETDEFGEWIQGLDQTSRLRVSDQIKHISKGDQLPRKTCKLLPRRKGLWEMKFMFDSGYRVYFCRCGKMIYLLLNGGNKGSQDADMDKAEIIMKREIGGTK